MDIIDEHGGLLAWRKTWKGSSKGSGSLPMSKNGYYSGINLTTLLIQQVKCAYQSNKWLTFNQIKERGFMVNKGEKATGVVFFNLKDMEDKKTGELKKIPLLRNYYVFNLCQTNMTPEELTVVDEEMSAEIEGFNIDAFNLVIKHGGDRAFYSPASDHIQMPNVKDFESVEAYQATFLHELTHWTGGRDNRLPRESIKLYGADIKQRAKEELVAEMGSLFLGVHYGINADVENHASYVKSWKTHCSLSDVAEAIKHATKAFKYIIETGKAA
jgi:antirestriction protein ArdC